MPIIKKLKKDSYQLLYSKGRWMCRWFYWNCLPLKIVLLLALNHLISRKCNLLTEEEKIQKICRNLYCFILKVEFKSMVKKKLATDYKMLWLLSILSLKISQNFKISLLSLCLNCSPGQYHRASKKSWHKTLFLKILNKSFIVL